MNMIEQVAKFMAAAEQQNDAKQTAKQLGFVLEEAGEALTALGWEDEAVIVDNFASYLKTGGTILENDVESADKAELLDAFLDIAWVAIGGAISMGGDVQGAWKEIVRSNMSKVDPETGKMLRDENGKVKKPPHYSKPNLAPFLATGI